MAKRFTDTAKYKKQFIRSLPGPYKLLWDFLYHDCDHAGIWIVDFQIAQTYLGADMLVDKETALALFNSEEQRIVVLNGGSKWFIPSFIEFQYGKLSEKNRAHINVISVLKKFNLLDENLLIKPLTSPLQGAKEKEQEKEKEKELGGAGGDYKPAGIVPDMLEQFTAANPNYPVDRQTDYPELFQLAGKIHTSLKLDGKPEDRKNAMAIRLRWGELVRHIREDPHFCKYSLTQVNKYYQSIVQSFSNGKSNTSGRETPAKPNGKPIPTGNVPAGGFGKL